MPRMMRHMRTESITLGQMSSAAKRADAELYLIKPVGWEFKLIRFASRKALEAFNRKAGLKPLVYTQVPKNMAVWKHESDSAARANA